MDDAKSFSSFGLFVLWFGAAVSVAEILTGGLDAVCARAAGIIREKGGRK